MGLNEKYQPVINMVNEYSKTDTAVNEQGGKLEIKSTVETQFQKNKIWDKIKEIGGQQPGDLVADIRVADTSFYDYYTVKSGDSLSKIAKMYYGDSNRYNEIFQANKDILKNPDQIQVGQKLKIPNPSKN